MFLYHQSVFSTPRFSRLIEIAPPIALGKFYLQIRGGEYKKSRIMRAYRRAREFTWHPEKR